MFRPGIIDPRPAEYRQRVNTLAVRDLKDCARWGLHLSTEEHDSLMAANPDTLGHPDHNLQDKYWHQFMTHPASKPYRIQSKV
jgi:hypothetical protein